MLNQKIISLDNELASKIDHVKPMKLIHIVIIK
jgi:hypothetical protein